MAGPVETVRAAMNAYVAHDRAAMERLLAPDYRFTSPMDNAIDRTLYFERCWPASAALTGMTIVHASEDGELAWIAYEGESAAKRFRNVELHRVRDGRIVETQVYFGWDVPHPAPQGGFVDETA
jgi:hypothetical protein